MRPSFLRLTLCSAVAACIAALAVDARASDKDLSAQIYLVSMSYALAALCPVYAVDEAAFHAIYSGQGLDDTAIAGILAKGLAGSPAQIRDIVAETNDAEVCALAEAGAGNMLKLR